MNFSIQYIFHLVDKFTPAAAAISAAAASMRTSIAAAGAAMAGMARKAAMVGGIVAAGFTVAMLGAASAAAKFEDKMAEVRKVVPSMTKDQMWRLGDDVLALSTKAAVTADKVADIYASGARMGIRGEESMARFADTVVKVVAAWDGVSASFAAESLATISGKFFNDLPGEEAQKRMVGVADAINYLAQNTPGVKNAELLKFFQNAGPMFAQMKLTAEEAAAYGAAAMMTGKSGGLEEGTRAQMSLQRMMLAATKPLAGKGGKPTDVAKAFKSIGLTQQEWAQMITASPQDAMLDLFGRMEGMPTLQRMKFLKDFLGDARAARQMVAMTNQLNEYKRSLAQVSDKYAMRFAREKSFMEWMHNAYPEQARMLDQQRRALHYGSVDQEFTARMDTFLKQQERFARAREWFTINLGRPLLPAFSSIDGGLADATAAVADFMGKHQEMVKYLGTAGAITAVGAAGYGLLQLAAWATGAASALAVLKGLGMISLQLAVVAIGIASLYWIYDNWPRIKAFAADPLNFEMHFPDAPEWLKQWMSFRENSKAQSQAGDDFRSWWSSGALPPDLAAAKQQPGLWNLWNMFSSSPPESSSVDPSRIPQSAAERLQIESQIKGQIDPLQVTTSPISVNVNVTGTVNGPVTGSGTGSGEITTNAPRGVSTQEAGQAVVAP